MLLRSAEHEGGHDGVFFVLVFAVDPEGAGIDGGAVDGKLVDAVVGVAPNTHEPAVEFGHEDPSALVSVVDFEPVSARIQPVGPDDVAVQARLNFTRVDDSAFDVSRAGGRLEADAVSVKKKHAAVFSHPEILCR